MTHYKNCKNCGNENFATVYMCNYCGIIYCSKCKRGLPRCSKHLTNSGRPIRHEDDTIIGLIPGFCRICKKSLFNQKICKAGYTQILYAHENCIQEYLDTEEGKEWISEQKQIKEQEEKEAVIRKSEFKKRQEELNKKEDKEYKINKIKKLILFSLIIIGLCLLIYRCFIR